jgi:hypothetical protein
MHDGMHDIKENEIISFAGKWIELGLIMLREIRLRTYYKYLEYSPLK